MHQFSGCKRGSRRNRRPVSIIAAGMLGSGSFAKGDRNRIVLPGFAVVDFRKKFIFFVKSDGKRYVRLAVRVSDEVIDPQRRRILRTFHGIRFRAV